MAVLAAAAAEAQEARAQRRPPLQQRRPARPSRILGPKLPRPQQSRSVVSWSSSSSLWMLLLRCLPPRCRLPLPTTAAGRPLPPPTTAADPRAWRPPCAAPPRRSTMSVLFWRGVSC